MLKISLMSTTPVERVTLVPCSPWRGEHRSRYHFAARFVAGRSVLDVACGTGFGGPILLRAGARRVLGLDLSWDGLEEAALSRTPGYDLGRADATRLPLPDGSFGAVTSFETLEHIPQYETFLRELRRVLGSDGVLVVTTPNALHTKPVEGVPRNPFHVREFTPSELRTLLGAHFRQVEILGQRPHPRYRPCPYWESPEVMPRDTRTKLRVLWWKVQCRMPNSLREGLSRLLSGRDFYPGESDFVFTPDAAETGHVLVGVCRP